MAFGTPAVILSTGQRDANGTANVTMTGSQVVATSDLLTITVGANTVSSLNATWSATDNLGNTWQVDNSRVQGTSGQSAILSTRVSSPGTLTTVTLSNANSCGRIIAIVQQTTGLVTSGTYVDTTPTAAAVGSGTSTAPLTASSGTLANTGELAMVSMNCAAGATVSSASTGYTLQGAGVSTNGTTDRRTQGSYDTSVGTAAEQPGMTISSSVAWAICAAFYIPQTATNVNLTGAVSPIALAAPAGTVTTVSNVSLTGAVSPLALAAPAGSVKLSVNLTAAPAPIALAAPAGSVSATGSVNLTGAVSALTLAAPAGTVTVGTNVNLTGQVSPLALASPAGSLALVSNVALAGTVSALALSAPSGTVSAVSAAPSFSFSSPLSYAVSDTANLFWDRLTQQRSISILKNGSSYQQVIGPSNEQIEAADVTYLGGHIYSISAAEAAALTAAGYGAGVTTN